MAMEMFEIPGSDTGNTAPLQVPMCAFTVNDHQQFNVIGCDFSIVPIETGSTVQADGSVVTSSAIGKLSDLDTTNHFRLLNSLRREKWDFDKFPNPEILLVERT